MKFSAIILSFCFSISTLYSQSITRPVNGVHDDRTNTYRLEHVNVVYGTDGIVKTDAIVIIKKGIIVVIADSKSIASLNSKDYADAQVVDCKGLYMYPSFIDLYSDYGVAKLAKTEKSGAGEQYLSKKKGAYYWNQAIHPETDASVLFSQDNAQASNYRTFGFGMALVHQTDGIARGTSSLVNFTDNGDQLSLLRANITSCLSFSKGLSSQDYPSSLMGSIALLRQLYYDGQTGLPERNLSVEAYQKNFKSPVLFQAEDPLNVLRAHQLSKEFNQTFWIKTNGNDFKHLKDYVGNNLHLIVPINFPKALASNNPLDAQHVSWTDLKSWECAPFNPRYLAENNIDFVITANGCKSADEFLKNLRKAVHSGWSEKSALAALTIKPASYLGIQKEYGSIEIGKHANFILCNGPLFEDKTLLIQNWIEGAPYVLKDNYAQDLRGTYAMNTEGLNFPFQLICKGNLNDYEWSLVNTKDNTKNKLKVNVSVNRQQVRISFNYPKKYFLNEVPQKDSLVELHLIGEITAAGMEGVYLSPLDANLKPWKAIITKTTDSSSIKKSDKIVELPELRYPFNPYGNVSLPKPVNFVFRNATICTNTQQGNIKADLWIRNGKIYKIGTNLTCPDSVKSEDFGGMFISPGIIDEHSHIAANGDVNEGTQSVTSEVRLGDVINSDDINIYRQLSGGVTSSHILHGSANPIGGQTQLIKLRWGMSPEEMKFRGAPGFIKFALGENVKQANWGENAVTRFPQTRMGVEQVLLDAFSRAKEYDLQKSKTIPAKFHKDLELEALVEIMHSQRFITCHSYVQSEINMLMHVADSFGFKVNTFTHILEGYKVADKMARHGVSGASTFSDWWAYKFEVMEAIPQNASLMSRWNIPVGINSDDAEMGRRLNQEAAKSVKYGGMNEMDAIKMCTLNPAKMLHVDAFVGSLAEGKDADFVVWTAAPLSVYAVATATYVDGICYYSLQDANQKSEFIKQDKQRLWHLMQDAKTAGEAVTNASASGENTYYSCGGEEDNH
jgi:imidazolonepropionase-like amidohydrolase